MNVGMFVWLRADIARVDAGLRTELVGVRDGLALANERLARVAAALSEQSERLARLEDGQNALRGDLAATNARLTRIEAALSEHGQRMGGLEAGQAEVRGELTATDERMARVEGTVADALGRPFPERMAQAPEPETGADGRSATRRRRACGWITGAGALCGRRRGAFEQSLQAGGLRVAGAAEPNRIP